MRIALVDPSLFTLPYDTALARALSGTGADTVLYGRAPRLEDGAGRVPGMTSSFYKISESGFIRRLPKPLRLAVKGIDHFGSMRSLGRRFRRDPPDVVHFQWLSLPLVDASFVHGLRRKMPVVLTVHDTDPFNGSPTAALQKAGFRRALQACDRLVVHTSQGLERLLAMGIEKARIWSLPHGPLAEVPEALQVDNFAGKLTFVLFGKIKPYKGADILIDAFAKLPSHLQTQARIKIVGQPYMDIKGLIERAARLGVGTSLVLEPRFVADADVPDIFAAGSVAVFPYREIEASGVLSLALAAGRPVLASRLGSFADTLTDGLHGRLVPAGDIEALSAAMAGMIEDRSLTASFAREAAQLARAAPSWSDIAGQLMTHYQSLLNERAHSVPRHTQPARDATEFA